MNELDFEKQGEVYRDLIALLRNKSPHFAELIDKQVNLPVDTHVLYTCTVIYATADEADVYMFYRCFFCFFLLFPSIKKYETTVLGNG